MRSILNALQDGRLFELPSVAKDAALEFLARILDANPDVEVGTDVIELVQKREQECNTGIGRGVAVPHIRAKREEGDLFSAIGWSREGIDYGAADGEHVHLVFMYYIPGGQKNAYLKEISSLVKAMQLSGGIEPIAHAAELCIVRNLLLDWVTDASSGAGPESIARMIKLEAKQAQPPPPAAGARATRVRIVVAPRHPLLALAPDADLCAAIERQADLGLQLAGANGAPIACAGRQLFVLGQSTFPDGKALFDCVAVS